MLFQKHMGCIMAIVVDDFTQCYNCRNNVCKTNGPVDTRPTLCTIAASEKNNPKVRPLLISRFVNIASKNTASCSSKTNWFSNTRNVASKHVCVGIWFQLRIHPRAHSTMAYPSALPRNHRTDHGIKHKYGTAIATLEKLRVPLTEQQRARREAHLRFSPGSCKISHLPRQHVATTARI